MSDKLRKAILDLVQRNMKITITSCIVKTVNQTEDTCLCEPVGGGADFQDVKLRSIIDTPTATSTRSVVYPKVESVVLVGIINGDDNNTFVMQVSEIDSIRIQMNSGMEVYLKNDQTINIKAPRTIFNGGSFNGMVKVNELVTKLNNIETNINTLKGAIGAWAPVNADGIALKALLAVWVSNFLTTTTAFMLENPKVQH